MHRVTCHKGFENHFPSNPAFRLADMSARKFQNPLKSFTSRLSESLGNSIPGISKFEERALKGKCRKTHSQYNTSILFMPKNVYAEQSRSPPQWGGGGGRLRVGDSKSKSVSTSFLNKNFFFSLGYLNFLFDFLIVFFNLTGFFSL